MNYRLTVIPVIEANYHRFTPMERIIADFFIANTEDMDFSSKAVAGKLHVSEASLSRFAKKMGYAGFKEFIYHYSPSIKPPAPEASAQSLDVLNAYQELLNKTYNLMDEFQIERVVRLLEQKRRIFVCGFGNSGLAAQEFKLRFLRLGLDVRSITEFHELMIHMARVDGDCLVIGISLSGATREITDTLMEAAGAGAATVYITSHNENRWQEAFDEVMLTAVKKNLEYGNVISPQFPILVLIDILYAGYLSRHGAEEKHDVDLWAKIKKYRNSPDLSIP